MCVHRPGNEPGSPAWQVSDLSQMHTIMVYNSTIFYISKLVKHELDSICLSKKTNYFLSL